MKTIVPRIGRYPPLVVAKSDTPILEIARRMRVRLVRHAPVVNDYGKLVGIVSAKNIVNFLGGGEKGKIVEKKYGGDLYSALTMETASSIMTKNVEYVRADVNLGKLVELMMTKDIGALPVVDEEGRVLGIVSERHITKLLSHHAVYVRVSNIMSSPPITAEPDECVLSVQKTMIANDIRRILLVKGKRLVGIATIKDLIRFYTSDETLESLKKGLVREVQGTPIAKIATTDVATIPPSADVSEVAKIVRERDIGALPVVDKDKLIGIVTERDILLKLPRISGVEVFVDVINEVISIGWVYF